MKTVAKSKIREKRSIFLNIYFGILIVYSILMVLLLVWGIMTSIKTAEDFRLNKIGLPSGMVSEWGWNNFAIIIKNFSIDVSINKGGVFVPSTIGIAQMVINSLMYSIGGAFALTICSCFVAYLTCKFRYKFSSIVFTFVITAMIIPIIGQQPSELQLLRNLHIYDTMIGNWIQKFHFLGMYYLVFYAAFKSIPGDFSEAAYVDGASEMTVFVRIMLPMVKTMFLTIFLVRFIDLWNDYQGPLLYLPSSPTVAYGVYIMGISSRSNELSSTPVRLASCIIMAVPILVLFIMFKNRLIGNLSMGGIKG